MPEITNGAGRKLYVLRRISTGDILNHETVYPNAVDDAPLIGSDPDLEYLAIDRDIQPLVDENIYQANLGAGEKVAGKWHQPWVVTDLPAATIKLHALNRKAFENGNLITQAESNELLALVIRIIRKEGKSLGLTTDEVAMLSRYDVVADKLDQNLRNYSQIVADVDAGKKPNVKSGWATAS